MSKYDDNAKDDLAYEIETFLKDHPVSELLEVVTNEVQSAEYYRQ